MNREAIYKALFAKLESIEQLTTASRILQHWDDVSPNQQPALFMCNDTQNAEQVTGFPSKYKLGAKVWIYCHRDTNGIVPSAQVNDILDAIDEALRPLPSPVNSQTLGGLVHHCWVDGPIETDEGTLGLQSVAIVPISMLVVNAQP